MIRGASPVLFLVLAIGACNEDPVLGADVDLSDVALESSPPVASRTPSFSSPPLTRQDVPGFAGCKPAPPPRPSPYVPCAKAGDFLCLAHRERIRSIGEDDLAVTEVRPLLAACLRPS